MCTLICTLFCLVQIKKHSYFTSCVFWFPLYLGCFILLMVCKLLSVKVCMNSNKLSYYYYKLWQLLGNNIILYSTALYCIDSQGDEVPVILPTIQFCFSKNSTNTAIDTFSKLDLCKGGSLSPMICKSDIKLSISHISCFISVCPFVASSNTKFAKHLHIVLSSPH